MVDLGNTLTKKKLKQWCVDRAQARFKSGLMTRNEAIHWARSEYARLEKKYHNDITSKDVQKRRP